MSRKFTRIAFAAVFALALSMTIHAETFYAYLSSAQEVPVNASTATGYARVVVNEAAGTISFTVVFSGLSSNQTASHIHAPAAIGANAAVAINFGSVGGTSGTITGSGVITPTQLAALRAHMGYVNVHSVTFGGGEIRGQLGIKRPVDYDGDGKSDISVLRFPSVAPPGVASITYYSLGSTTGFQSAAFGDANLDFPAPGDYDGDGKDDLSLYRDGATVGAPSVFYQILSGTNTFRGVTFGVSGDQAISRDYDGDGKTDIAVFREGATTGLPATWLILRSSDSVVQTTLWGTTGDGVSAGDTPVPGDYDGDGKFDLAVYRFGGLAPDNTYLILRSSDNGFVAQQWGNFVTDYVLPGDYDGDGKFDFVAGRVGGTAASPMVWYILQSSNGQIKVQPFGISSDFPTQGDYDGDGRTDVAVYRNGATVGSQSFFYVLRSFDNVFQTYPWGVRGDFPVNTFDAR